ncbi:MAG: hypothetical protein RBR15_00325 [Sphaerochaeta sp.]|nr:hypothetical protein [Sphaerochaeta sp.]
MQSGLTLRKRAIFDKQDGRSVIIALDHGSIAGPMAGITNPSGIVRECVKAQVDGILTTKGFVDASLAEWERPTSLVLRLSGGFTLLGEKFEEEMIADPETALAYGASCAAITVKFGHEREGAFIRQASLAIDRCHSLGLPVMLEAMARGSIGGKEVVPHDSEAIRMVARMGAEIGADLIKTYYTGSVDSFARVVEGCPVPILILGGAKTESVRDVLQTIHDSLEAGGCGIAMGRNIWGFGKVGAMLEAVNGLVHGHWGVDKALAKVEA